MDVSREQFDLALEELFAALDKPLGDAKKQAFWNGLEHMTFVQFCRARDRVIAELREGETPKTFGVGAVWAAYKRTRARGPMPTVAEVLQDREHVTGRQPTFEAEFRARFGSDPP